MKYNLVRGIRNFFLFTIKINSCTHTHTHIHLRVFASVCIQHWNFDKSKSEVPGKNMPVFKGFEIFSFSIPWTIILKLMHMNGFIVRFASHSVILKKKFILFNLTRFSAKVAGGGDRQATSHFQPGRSTGIDCTVELLSLGLGD